MSGGDAGGSEPDTGAMLGAIEALTIFAEALAATSPVRTALLAQFLIAAQIGQATIEPTLSPDRTIEAYQETVARILLALGKAPPT